MERPLAILCSGQGAQHPATFDLVAANPEAEPIFAAAAAVLGQDPRDVVRVADAATLYSDRIGKILCCTQAMAAWAALGEARPRVVVMAGYSVGEVAAWGCAGAIGAEALFPLIQERAIRMDAAAPADGGLAVIVGIRPTTLHSIVAHHAAFIARIDDVDTFVIGGSGTDLDAACQDANAAGARRVVRLRVAVPPHTPLLSSASEPFLAALRAAAPRLPESGCHLLSGIGGAILRDIDTGIEKLARQMSSPIDWAACLESCRACHAAAALELGP
ncbi:acyltransferase domain-containing protein [Roseomonas sp. HJA6]|uniref:Acyltransferase domain-containing protein n=1 Tax=Roseomonas alba TaxID=2846776 RepID=A0ABS7AHY1_9PROT|nr:acyltransferase domain-containing protein [Neoroseomonas alba]MBW6401327.1 acyltransferase domain-containing protein [Neoroseomonas alba]